MGVIISLFFFRNPPSPTPIPHYSEILQERAKSYTSQDITIVQNVCAQEGEWMQKEFRSSGDKEKWNYQPGEQGPGTSPFSPAVRANSGEHLRK